MKLFILIITLLILLNPLAAEASVLPACTATGNCGLCDFFDTFINIINWLLGVVGGIALFLFGWHGFGMITSAGNPEKVTAARKGMNKSVCSDPQSVPAVQHRPAECSLRLRCARSFGVQYTPSSPNVFAHRRAS
mgnify:CR=1 FL=1